MKHRCYIYLLTAVIFMAFSADAQDVYKNESILKEGTFYKVPIQKSGVYKIDQEYLKKIAPDINIDINTVQIFGNGGASLPESTSAARVDDLDEIPTILRDNTLTFFAEGAVVSIYDPKGKEHRIIQNPYSTDNYVFLKINGNNPKRILTSDQNSATVTVLGYTYVQILDNDNINLLHFSDPHFGSGREWYQERIGSKKNYESSFDFSHTQSGSALEISAKIAARCNRSGTLTLKIDQESITSSFRSVNLNNTDYDFASRCFIEGSIPFSSPMKNISFDLKSSGSQCEGWLDYLQITTREQAIGDAQRVFWSGKSSTPQVVKIAVDDAESHTFLDVSDMHTPKLLTTQGKYLITTQDTIPQRLVAYRNSNRLVPKVGVKLENQNLHAQTPTELVIVYHSKFKTAVEKLAEHRSKHDNITVTTTDIDAIYNEYSSGKVDPTAIRDFSRMLWTRDQNFKYLLLFGDATFDYRYIMNDLSKDNYIPAYETTESLDPILSYPSDDYYGLLDNEAGGLRNSILDINIGRLPVTDINNADAIVNKIIHYDTGKKRFGKWRTNIAYIADDEDSNAHMSSAERIALRTENKYSNYNQSKVYFDAYNEVSTPGGGRYYDATEDLNNKIQSGQLVVCYLGHGGPKGWAQERVLRTTDVDTWTNYDNMPILVTATCTFAGYDDASRITAGEYCLQKEDGGAIALFTTVRPVFSNSNEALTKAVFDTIFSPNINGIQTLGEIVTAAKNSLNRRSENMRKFTLLGDPSQKIALPTYHANVLRINGKKISEELDTLSAFDVVTLEGNITDHRDEEMTSFDGTLEITIFDKKSALKTLANNGGRPFGFQAYKNIIFRGSTEVKAGRYSVSFVVPRDINYEIGRGRVALYAYTDAVDAFGATTEVYIGGSSSDPKKDDLGPEVALYIDSRNFKDGDVVSRHPVLIADLNDDLGINVTGSSIGHDITAVIDGNSSNPFILNEFYNAAVGDYTKGSIVFPLHDLDPGKHTLTLKAWDAANNSGSSTVTFIVPEVSDAKVEISTSPNPFSSFMNIKIDQNAFLSYDAEVVIVDEAGRHVIRQLFENVVNDGIIIDNKIGGLNSLRNKTLFCKIILRSKQFNSSLESTWQKVIKL